MALTRGPLIQKPCAEDFSERRRHVGVLIWRCPVDFSDNSIAVLDQAAQLARRDGALLYLLHVEFVPMNGPVQLTRYASVSMEPKERRLQQIAAGHLQNVPHQILLRSGWPGITILWADATLW
jgi:hypothetical protein